MNAWLFLTKKEFRLGLPSFLMVLIFFSGIIAGGVFAGNQFGFEDEFMSIALAIVLGLHTLFLVVYLYYSLNAERRRLHLWLHTPMSIAGLLASKLFTGVVYMLSTFIISIILAIQSFKNTFSFVHQESLFNSIGSTSVIVLIAALFMGSVFLLFWSVYLTFSQKWNDFISFLLTVVLIFVSVWAYAGLLDIPFLQALTNWGAIHAGDIFIGFEMSYIEDSFDIQTMEEATVFYIGHFVRDIFFAVIMFIAACWIIERKVEV
ncbi:hypothetical protein CWR48_05355 [Oceanobacillus arenosus]|uniref:Uncharacterized protein n=1 Tax=Oceanobacillus arenosus TaxID=1229153 RepID=A0A3D8PZG6_9BACI|nr:hypothetical protein [Oceanobacillus arenosus]RDW20135.1 hypothetical protein CWR48_05355 [Oceanobacillus arenosus]